MPDTEGCWGHMVGNDKIEDMRPKAELNGREGAVWYMLNI